MRMAGLRNSFRPLATPENKATFDELVKVLMTCRTQEHAEFDTVVLATGYRRDDHKRLLAGVAEHIDGYAVARDYRLRTEEAFLPRIYLQGCCEDSHGLSDTLLSVLAVRSVEILDALLADGPGSRHRQEPLKPRFSVAV